MYVYREYTPPPHTPPLLLHGDDCWSEKGVGGVTDKNTLINKGFKKRLLHHL